MLPSRNNGSTCGAPIADRLRQTCWVAGLEHAEKKEREYLDVLDEKSAQLEVYLGDTCRFESCPQDVLLGGYVVWVAYATYLRKKAKAME